MEQEINEESRRTDGAEPQEVSQAAELQEEKQPEGKKKKEKEKKSLGMEILSWVWTILIAVAAALVIRSFIFEPVRVDGASMNDTLENGEVMFVSKWNYASTWLSFPWQDDDTKENAPRLATGFGAPKQFDVVICRYPGRGDTNFVKRLIGMPGDRVRIEGGYLYINDQKYEEPYISDEYRTGSGAEFSEAYIPKKGDLLSLEYTDDSQSSIGVYVNGEGWGWRGISSKATAEDGSTLVYHRDGRLLLNGEDITTDLEAIKGLVGKKFTLDQDLYFVMGDHRNNSNDSRAQGPITRDMLVGQVQFVFFPFGSARGVK